MVTVFSTEFTDTLPADPHPLDFQYVNPQHTFFFRALSLEDRDSLRDSIKGACKTLITSSVELASMHYLPSILIVI